MGEPYGFKDVRVKKIQTGSSDFKGTETRKVWEGDKYHYSVRVASILIGKNFDFNCPIPQDFWEKINKSFEQDRQSLRISKSAGSNFELRVSRPYYILSLTSGEDIFFGFSKSFNRYIMVKEVEGFYEWRDNIFFREPNLFFIDADGALGKQLERVDNGNKDACPVF